jgi:hypothetical protein
VYVGAAAAVPMSAVTNNTTKTATRDLVSVFIFLSPGIFVV